MSGLILTDEDWLRRSAWTLPIDSLDDFLNAYPKEEDAVRFVNLDAALAMPVPLLRQVVWLVDNAQRGSMVPSAVRARIASPPPEVASDSSTAAKALSSTSVKSSRITSQEPYDPDARDGDNDGIVQDGTPWERPAGTRIVNELGEELRRGLDGELPQRTRIVDRDGNAVDYTPKGDKPDQPEKPEPPTISGPQPKLQNLQEMGLRPVTEIVNAPPPAPPTPMAVAEPAPETPALPYVPGQYPEEVLAEEAASREDRLIQIDLDNLLGLITRFSENDERNYREEIMQALGIDDWEEARRQFAERIAEEEFREVLLEQMEKIRSGEVWVAIDADSLVRFLKEGRYKSQFESGKSGGAFFPDLRSRIERDFMGVPEDIDPALRPTYGFIPHGFSDIHEETAVRQYGPFIIRLRPEVKERTTFTIGDSLGRELYGMPMTGELPTGGSEEFPPGWVTAYLTNAPSSSSQWQQIIEREAIMRALENIGVDPTGLSGSENRGRPFQNISDYQEAQIHGGFGVGDVAEVVVDPKVFADGVPQEVQDAISNAGIPLELRGEAR